VWLVVDDGFCARRSPFVAADVVVVGAAPPPWTRPTRSTTPTLPRHGLDCAVDVA